MIAQSVIYLSHDSSTVHSIVIGIHTCVLYVYVYRVYVCIYMYNIYKYVCCLCVYIFKKKKEGEKYIYIYIAKKERVREGRKDPGDLQTMFGEMQKRLILDCMIFTRWCGQPRECDIRFIR